MRLRSARDSLFALKPGNDVSIVRGVIQADDLSFRNRDRRMAEKVIAVSWRSEQGDGSLFTYIIGVAQNRNRDASAEASDCGSSQKVSAANRPGNREEARSPKIMRNNYRRPAYHQCDFGPERSARLRLP
jgi:hypothetical protein